MAKKKNEVIETKQSALEVTVENENVVTEGFVTNCVKLNIRKEGKINAAVVTIVPVNTKLIIDTNKSTKNWLSVTTPDGIKGYCMSEYVNLMK